MEEIEISASVTRDADPEVVGDIDNTVSVQIPGPKGDPGYTPVKGVDYWTEEDIAEIKQYVDEAILGGAW